LLDEVGEVSTGMQVKLLRVLQEREVRRVGENKKRSVDVRIIAATNRDLQAGVQAGTFRQDLFYRLNVVALRLPSLRERRDDVLALARVLLGDINRRMKRQVTEISPAAVDKLLRYGWPGNVRELENAMERAVALAHGTRVEVEDLPEEVRDPVSVPTVLGGVVRPLDDIEKDYILAALRANGGNQALTASQLQISPATMYRRLKSFGMIEDRVLPPKPDDP
jgi:transcriptional regulator with PAS, ATPase and Fis domain